MDTTRTQEQTRAELATLEMMVALVGDVDDAVPVRRIMAVIDEPIDIVRLAAAILVRDGRITVERRDPPEESLVSMTDCEENGVMIRMLAAYERKRAAQEAAPKVRKRKATAK